MDSLQLRSPLYPSPPPSPNLPLPSQVRFGVLQAGQYGVSQSRTRAFIWAAAPGFLLPDWPAPLHVFATAQLSVPLPNGQQFVATQAPGSANGRAPGGGGDGAPLRAITVRDAIGDLPAVENGAEGEEMEVRVGREEMGEEREFQMPLGAV